MANINPGDCYEFDPFHYRNTTRQLTHAQHGAYRLLIDHCMMGNGYLPSNRLFVYRLVSAMDSEEQRNVDEIISLYFRKSAKGFKPLRKFNYVPLP